MSGRRPSRAYPPFGDVACSAAPRAGPACERVRALLPEPLDFALIKRLREVLDDRPATESELRTLKEQSEAWARTVGGQIESSERRIRRLDQSPSSSLAQIASELRRVEQLRPQLNEVRAIRTRDLTTCPTCTYVASCTRCPGLAYMEGNMRGPSSADCEKSMLRAGASGAEGTIL